MAGHVKPWSPPAQSSHYHHHGHPNNWFWIKSCRVWNKLFKINMLTVLYFVQNWEKGDLFLFLRFRDHRSLMLSGPHLGTVKISVTLWRLPWSCEISPHSGDKWYDVCPHELLYSELPWHIVKSGKQKPSASFVPHITDLMYRSLT